MDESHITSDLPEATDPGAAAEAASAPEDQKKILALAHERFKQAYEALKDDFEDIARVQEFIAGEQWPTSIKSERENNSRPCLVLDHLNQYVRHVVNNGLMRPRDIRVLPMNGEADDKVAEVLAGIVRQITQTSTAKVAYGTGLRHAAGVGLGYWRVKVQGIPGTDLEEIVVRKIKEPRMVIMDPFCDYPDGRDAEYVFVLTKFTKSEFQHKWPQAVSDGVQSWHVIDASHTLPWITGDPVVVAEYYYRDGEQVKWAICTPSLILDSGIHHGPVIPIIRCMGEEYELRGKDRRRGMINASSMDAQRAYNYSSSAFIESVALAPLSPFVAAEGQVEDYMNEWKDAHRIPRAVLRYKPSTIGNQLVPPPERSAPAGIPAGWQGMMQSLIMDTQLIMGVAHPAIQGTGGAPVQSGAGVEAQQAPAEINTFHFSENWYIAIEQTGRVILAMIPHVYTKVQAVKIIGTDGVPQTAMLNPFQDQTMLEQKETIDGIEKVLSVGYNPKIGRYDVAVTTGPSSATKRSEANKLLTTLMNSWPDAMKVAGDLIVQSFDMAGADVLAKRLKALLPPGIGEDEGTKVQMLQQAMGQVQQLQAQVAELNQIVLAEREKSQAQLAQSQLKARTELLNATERHQSELRLERMRLEAETEMNLQDNIVRVLIETMKLDANKKLTLMKEMSKAAQAQDAKTRMSGYFRVLESMTPDGGSHRELEVGS